MSRKDVIRPSAGVVILNYDLLISPSIFTQLIKCHFSVGIFDESHYLKSRTAKRTKAVLLKNAVASRCIYKYFLTGTPILNRPAELYPVLKAVAPHIIEPYNTFEKFAYHFCGAYWDGFQLIATGATHMDELCTRLQSGFMLRRLKKDHLKDLPAKQYQMIVLPAEDAKTKDRIKKEFTFSKEDASLVSFSEGGAEISKIRHDLALSKVETCIEHIKGVLEESQKLVVFAYHKDVIAQLANGLWDFAPVSITGDTPAAARQEFVDLFQTDSKRRVFIGQIDAAGVAITLTAASTVIFVESSWVPGIVDQAIDRCHRIGQKDSVLAQFLVIQDSLEEYMIRTLIDKRQTIERIVDQDPKVAEMFL
jgi:SWI/SNF-related matrix-associated actin-dependent regulator 1 of chromatin subfamily A